MDAGEAWGEGYISAWREAAMYCAGRAAAVENPHARLALWETYEALNRQADLAIAAFKENR